LQKQDATSILREAIFQKELELSDQGKLLKEDFNAVYENFKLVNLIKNALRGVIESKEIKGNVLDIVIGMATGYVSKKVMIGTSHNPVKNVLGNLVQIGITSLVTKNPESIKTLGSLLIQSIFKRKKSDINSMDEHS